MNSAAVVPPARLRTEDLVPMSGFFSTPKARMKKVKVALTPRPTGGQRDRWGFI